jgi:hypothetical protein
LSAIIFSRTRHTYDSYHDFWELVRLSGFQSCYVDQVDFRQPVTYITTMVNDEWQAMVERQANVPRYAHLIFWNLERPVGWAGTVGAYAERCRTMMYARWFDEIWVSDRRLAQETELRFVIMGSHPELGTPNWSKRYDLVHMSVPVNRRQTIYKRFDEGRIAPNCWPPERDKVLQLSKFALNVHQDVHPFQEPLRFALFAAYGLPILSEVIYDSFPWNEATMTWATYDGLVPKLEQMLQGHYAPWQKMGERGRQMMTVDYRFDKVVIQAVRESTER